MPSFDMAEWFGRTGLSQLPFYCAQCDRPIETVIASSIYNQDAWRIHFFCHGQEENLTISGLLIYQCKSYKRLLHALQGKLVRFV